MTNDIVDILEENGCKYLFMGVETLNPDVAEGLNKVKNGQGENYVIKAKKAYKMLEKTNLKKSVFLIFGGTKIVHDANNDNIEVESFEDMKETIKSAIFDLKPTHLSFNILRFIPDSIIAKDQKFYNVRPNNGEVITGAHYYSKYKQIYDIKSKTLSHPIFEAFESAGDRYPIPKTITPKIADDILAYIIEVCNRFLEETGNKIELCVGDKFKKYLSIDKYGKMELLETELGKF